MRDRVKELRRVRAGDLRQNPSQWRTHSDSQRRALQGVMAEIGFAGAALAYEQDGQLILADGHLRSSLDPNAIIPVLVLELNAEEAKKLLAVYDPLGAMAGQDQEALLALLGSVKFQDQAINDLLEALANDEFQSLPDFPPLPEGDRPPIGQMTFTVETVQRAVIEEALDQVKAMGSFGDTGNENSNGNALAKICELFLSRIVHA